MNVEAEQVDSSIPVTSPVNIGNDVEFTIAQLVDVIQSVLDEVAKERGTVSEKLRVENKALPVDDPRQRRPDISRAKELLNWTPTWKLVDGVKQMALSYLKRIEEGEL
jgi:UDP-glucuronate decarboxylase